MKRAVPILVSLGILPGCVSHEPRQDETVTAVVEIRGFVPFESRVWASNNKGGSVEYEFHRLDFRVLKPESQGRVLSVWLPLQDWPDAAVATPGHILSIRLKAKDLAGATDPILPEYRLAELQAKKAPPEPSRL